MKPSAEGRSMVSSMWNNPITLMEPSTQTASIYETQQWSEATEHDVVSVWVNTVNRGGGGIEIRIYWLI